MTNALGGKDNFATTAGSRAEAITYADSMAIARAQLTVERVKNQLDPLLTQEMLPVYEAAYGLVPGPDDSIHTREHALAATMLIAAGARYTAVTASLAAALGSDFLAYRVTPQSEAINFPADPSAANGPCKWTDKAKAPELVRIATAITVIGSPVRVPYTALNPSPAFSILAGDTIVVSVNNIGLAERVIITAVGANSFTATFTKSHDLGDIATTGYFPYWRSTKKHSLVVLTAAACQDPQKVRLANRVMAQIATSFSSWDIVPAASGTTTVPVAIDGTIRARVGYAAVGAVTYP
jgi:hypothetical protein